MLSPRHRFNALSWHTISVAARPPPQDDPNMYPEPMGVRELVAQAGCVAISITTGCGGCSVVRSELLCPSASAPASAMHAVDSLELACMPSELATPPCGTADWVAGSRASERFRRYGSRQETKTRIIVFR